MFRFEIAVFLLIKVLQNSIKFVSNDDIMFQLTGLAGNNANNSKRPNKIKS